MLKAQVLRRSFSLFRNANTSHVVRSAARDGHDMVHVQRVHFRKPFISRRRLVPLVIYSTIAYGVFRYLDDVDEEELKEIEEEERQREERKARQSATRKDGAGGRDSQAAADGAEEGDEDEEYEDEEDEGEPLFFLPTGFARLKPQEFYKGTDPEWLEFVRLAPDKDRMDKIRSQFVGMVRDAAAQNTQYVGHIGKIDVGKGATWVDVSFPSGPPRDYERPGIEVVVTDEDIQIRKTTRTIPAWKHKMLSSHLTPIPVAYSLYANLKGQVSRQWSGVCGYMGWDAGNNEALAQTPPSSPPAPNAGIVRDSTKKMNSQTSQKPPSETTSTATATKGSTEGTPTPRSPEKEQDPQLPSSTATLNKVVSDRFGIALPELPTTTMDLSTFHAELRKKQRKFSIGIPRGTCLFHGLVELKGTKGIMTLDCQGLYNPKTGQMIVVGTKIRSMKHYRQVPRG